MLLLVVCCCLLFVLVVVVCCVSCVLLWGVAVLFDYLVVTGELFNVVD